MYSAFDFSTEEYDYLVAKCNFVRDEKQIFEMRRKGMSRIQISMELNMSERNVSKKLKSISRKIQKAVIKY